MEKLKIYHRYSQTVNDKLTYKESQPKKEHSEGKGIV